jgi:hypothetical protein
VSEWVDTASLIPIHRYAVGTLVEVATDQCGDEAGRGVRLFVVGLYRHGCEPTYTLAAKRGDTDDTIVHGIPEEYLRRPDA